MSKVVDLESLLAAAGTVRQQRTLFALLNLGLIESLSSGLLSADEAVRRFYNADNGLVVRKRLRAKAADVLMSRGVQLPDLFEALPTDQAHREFRHELAAMRSLCQQLLDEERRVA